MIKKGKKPSPVLLVEETGVPEETHRHAANSLAKVIA
jgi:hypothetical protein